MSSTQSLSHDLILAIAAATKAASLVQQSDRSKIEINYKEDNSLVTAMDKRAEQCIIDDLHIHSPHAILSEESGLIDGKSNATWIIDPIDGTSNFARDLPWHSVSIALQEGDRIQLGVIYNIAEQTLLYAEQGKGAFCNHFPIHVSDIGTPSRAVLCIEHGRSEQALSGILAVQKALNPDFDLRLTGSTAYEMTLVAQGKADAFISCGDKIWDFAAGICLIQEAGGIVSDWQGNPWQPDCTHLLASNAALHPILIQQFRTL